MNTDAWRVHVHACVGRKPGGNNVERTSEQTLGMREGNVIRSLPFPSLPFPAYPTSAHENRVPLGGVGACNVRGRVVANAVDAVDLLMCVCVLLGEGSMT